MKGLKLRREALALALLLAAAGPVAALDELVEGRLDVALDLAEGKGEHRRAVAAREKDAVLRSGVELVERLHREPKVEQGRSLLVGLVEDVVEEETHDITVTAFGPGAVVSSLRAIVDVAQLAEGAKQPPIVHLRQKKRAVNSE